MRDPSLSRPRDTPFAAADADLGDRVRRTLPGRHTKLVRVGEDQIAILYCQTHVVLYYADGSVQVSTGGYRGRHDSQGSATTKVRIQTYAPGFHRLWQSAKQWHVQLDGYPTAQPFVDGMTLYPDGVLLYPGESHVQAVARFVSPPPAPPPSAAQVRRQRREAQLDAQLTLLRVA